MNLSCRYATAGALAGQQTDSLLIVTLVSKSVTALYRRYRAVTL